jgi:hypothetical protein
MDRPFVSKIIVFGLLSNLMVCAAGLAREGEDLEGMGGGLKGIGGMGGGLKGIGGMGGGFKGVGGNGGWL